MAQKVGMASLDAGAPLCARELAARKLIECPRPAL